MPWKKLNLYLIANKIHRIKINILWNNQNKLFSHIGKGSNVCELPDVIGYQYISIGESFFCGKDVRIEAWEKYGDDIFNPEIVIADNVRFTDRVHLSCINRIYIGNGVLLGRDVFISDNSHGRSLIEDIAITPVNRRLYSKGPVIIRDNVWIGRQVTILSGVEIGEGAIIGANSVVLRSIPPHSVAAGNPAKVVKILDGD